jgi:hypothetical protein
MTEGSNTHQNLFPLQQRSPLEEFLEFAGEFGVRRFEKVKLIAREIAPLQAHGFRNSCKCLSIPCKPAQVAIEVLRGLPANCLLK